LDNFEAIRPFAEDLVDGEGVWGGRELGEGGDGVGGGGWGEADSDEELLLQPLPSPNPIHYKIRVLRMGHRHRQFNTLREWVAPLILILCFFFAYCGEGVDGCVGVAGEEGGPLGEDLRCE